MKKGYCHISVVLDRSGSMSSIKKDTIGGFNTFLKAQKEVPGEATLSLTQFDTEFTLVHSFVPINDVPDLNDETFVPRGGTALYDAVGLTIAGCGEKLAKMKEDERPEKVLIVIITDGEENSSRTYRYAAIQDMIKHQTDKYNWEFVFLGANINAERTGMSLGIKGGNSMTFAANADGVNAVYTSMAAKVGMYRGASEWDASCSLFDENDRAAQKEAGA